MAPEESTARGREPMDRRSGATVRALGKAFCAEVKDDRVTTLAGAFAYRTGFAIPALSILTVTVAAPLGSWGIAVSCRNPPPPRSGS